VALVNEPKPTQWLELSVAVDQEAVESVSELFARYGYQGGVVVEPAWEPTKEGDGWIGSLAPGEEPPPAYVFDSSRPVTLRTYLPLDAQAPETRQYIEQALWHLGQLRPIGQLQVQTLDEADWANAWKAHYTVQRIGERVVIVPSWLDYTPETGDIVLNLDPGMAFGTGLHPTTQLCLRLLETHMHPSIRVLDVGTGSGILAIAAAKMGAATVDAIDNDPIAVQAAQENVDRNQCGDRVQVMDGSLGTGQQVDSAPGYHIVVANLISHVLLGLAENLAAAMRPDGLLITSGIILEHEDEVALALAAAGLHLRERQRVGDWVALVHQHGVA
jgi:ribosomal protein L11 methyltransferase